MLKVRIWFLLLLMYCCVSGAEAQWLRIEEFKKVRRKTLAPDQVVKDKHAALLDLITDQTSFTVKAQGKNEAEVEEGDGMITVKLPHKTDFFTIEHPEFGQLNWKVPQGKRLKKKKHYRANLVCIDKDFKLTKQWLLLRIDPHDAVVTMDSTRTMVRDGFTQYFLPLGTHHYTIESPFHESKTDSVVLTDTGRVALDIHLNAIFAYLTVRTPFDKCVAQIYLDSKLMGKDWGTSTRVRAGNHRLTVLCNDICYCDSVIKLAPAEKRVIDLKAADLHVQSLQLVRSLQNFDDKFTAEELKLDTVDVNFDLARLDGVLSISCNVADAEVWVDEVPQGFTPCVVEGLDGSVEHTLQIRKPGYKDLTKKFRVQYNAVTELDLKLKRR